MEKTVIYILCFAFPHGDGAELVQAFYFKDHAEKARDHFNDKYKTKNYYLEQIELK
jgi:hypothetical protein